MSAHLRIPVALASGVLFGFGLSLSGMIDPAQVRGFLDITGHWNPRLAFVLAGAVVVAFIGVRLSRLRSRPVLETHFRLPDKTRIDRALIVGSAIFGIGWGIAGFCPGPAIAALSLGLPSVMVFVLAMIAGMVIHDSASARSRISSAPNPLIGRHDDT